MNGFWDMEDSLFRGIHVENDTGNLNFTLHFCFSFSVRLSNDSIADLEVFDDDAVEVAMGDGVSREWVEQNISPTSIFL